MDVWSEMAKEVRQNFGTTNGMKNVPKANTDSPGSGHADKELGIKASVSESFGSIKRNDGTAANMDVIKSQVDNVKTSIQPPQAVFASPHESLGGKHFSTDSNSSGVQSNSYSDLSENGGCMTLGMDTSSPEGTHRNLVQHITRGQCKGELQNAPIMSLPQYPPPCYTSSSIDFPQPKTSVHTPLQTNHRYPLQVSTHTYPYTTTSTNQYCSTTSGNRLGSDVPLAPSTAQVYEVQTTKNNTVHGTKQSNVYAYQPISGKVQIQRSTYDLRQSSKMAEVPIRSPNVSSEAIDQVSENNSCRLRYGTNYASRP